jgi:hypothetical protein
MINGNGLSTKPQNMTYNGLSIKEWKKLKQVSNFTDEQILES